MSNLERHIDFETKKKFIDKIQPTYLKKRYINLLTELKS